MEAIAAALLEAEIAEQTRLAEEQAAAQEAMFAVMM